MTSSNPYEKIKNLVEVDDDIFAVFSINAEKQLTDLNIAKNANIDEKMIEMIFNEINKYFTTGNFPSHEHDNMILGKPRWQILEYEKLRLLIIYENKVKIVVLIQSDTTLNETADNILGYYYEKDDLPKSLF